MNAGLEMWSGRAPVFDRVLLVDDQKIDRLMIGRLLSRTRFARTCVECPGAREALALLTSARAPVDLVLLDMNMPGLSGLEMLRHMEAEADAMQSPSVAIMLTEPLPRRDHLETEASPFFSGWISKPLTTEGLFTFVSENTGRHVAT